LTNQRNHSTLMMKSLFYGCSLFAFQKLTVQNSLALAPSQKRELHSTASHDQIFEGNMMFTAKEYRKGQDPVSFCMEVGQKYFEREKYVEAIPYFKKCIEVLSNKQNQEALQSECFFYIGESYLAISKFEEALEKYEHSLSILENCEQKCQKLLIKVNERLALVYDYQERPKLALDYFVKALELKQQTLQEDQVSIADTMANIASIYFKLGNSAKLEEYYQKATKLLEICSKQDTQRGSGILEIRIKLAPLQYNLQLYEDFAQNLKEAEKKLALIEKRNSTQIAENRISINYWKGSLNFALKQYDEAFSFYNNALDMSLRHYGKLHPKFQSFYSNIYWLNFMAGKNTLQL